MDKSTVAELSVAELRTLIRNTIRETLEEYVTEVDPDAGLDFRPEVAEYLRGFLRQPSTGTRLAEVRRELDVDSE